MNKNTEQTQKAISVVDTLKLARDLALDVRANANARLAAKAIALTGVIDEALAQAPTEQEQPAQQPVSVTDELVNAYCNAWEQSFTEDNPYHKVRMTTEDRKHIVAGLEAALAQAPTEQEQPAQVAEPRKQQSAERVEPVTVLPDGSAFAVMSYPLPKDHWLYADRQYNDGEYEPVELGKPVLTHELRDAVVSAVRYAIRGATNCGKEVDFDPDALVQNAVYALCGPFTSPPASKPWVGLTPKEKKEIERLSVYVEGAISLTEAKLREKNA